MLNQMVKIKPEISSGPVMNQVVSAASSLKDRPVVSKAMVVGTGAEMMMGLKSATLKNYEVVQQGAGIGTFGSIAYSRDKHEMAYTQKMPWNENKNMPEVPRTPRPARTTIAREAERGIGQSRMLGRNWFK